MRRNLFSAILIFFLVVVSVFSGCTDEPDNIKPIALFTLDPTSVNLNEIIHMNSTSTDQDGTIVNYTWSLNGEILGYTQNITKAFSENGTYTIQLKVVDDKDGSDVFERTVFVGDSAFLKEKLLGLWEWSDNNQTGNWTFYQNNTLKSKFTGNAGASVTDWWNWTFNHSQLCFYDPRDPFWQEGCYDFEFMDDYQTLKVTYAGNTAIWYKVKEE